MFNHTITLKDLISILENPSLIPSQHQRHTLLNLTVPSMACIVLVEFQSNTVISFKMHD